MAELQLVWAFGVGAVFGAGLTLGVLWAVTSMAGSGGDD
jgi:hypothetical protein